MLIRKLNFVPYRPLPPLFLSREIYTYEAATFARFRRKRCNRLTLSSLEFEIIFTAFYFPVFFSSVFPRDTVDEDSISLNLIKRAHVRRTRIDREARRNSTLQWYTFPATREIEFSSSFQNSVRFSSLGNFASYIAS